MDIQYLGIDKDADEPNGEYLGGRTTGCGCCSDNVRAANKADALKQLVEYEKDLQAALVVVKVLRKQVRKWKQ